MGKRLEYLFVIYRIMYSTQAKWLALVNYSSHKWRELVPSGRSVCRCHDVVLWCYVCVVLLGFSSLFNAFLVEAAPLRSIVLRYAIAPIAKRFFFFFSGIAFSEYFFVLSMEGMSYVRSFRMVLFYLVTTYGLEF